MFYKVNCQKYIVDIVNIDYSKNDNDEVIIAVLDDKLLRFDFQLHFKNITCPPTNPRKLRERKSQRHYTHILFAQ